jgi:hypothetical protein
MLNQKTLKGGNFIMKLIFRNKWNVFPLSRKIKDEEKRAIEQRLNSSSLDGLHKTIIGKHDAPDRDYAIYSLQKRDYRKIFDDVPANHNYYAGQILPNVFFILNIGELVWVIDHFEMMDMKKKDVKLKSLENENF